VPPTGAAAAPRERFTVTTDLLRHLRHRRRHVVNNRVAEGRGDRRPQATSTLLLDGAPARYVAQTGLIGGDFPNHKTVMTAQPGDRELKDGANELDCELRDRPCKAA
jgi:YidC/Oxa1 family membrane protein insertase